MTEPSTSALRARYQPAADDDIVVIGAGPAGLTAAYELAKAGRSCTILEATDVVGGISQTAERDGWRFDIGGHRFFTKVKPVEDLWHEILSRRRVPPPPADEPDLLPGQVLRLPDQADERAAEPRPRRGRPLRGVLPLGQGPTAQGPEHPRGLRRGRLRPPALRALLQDLQREGLGGVALEAVRRLRRPADQGHVAVPRRVGADPRPAVRLARRTGPSRSPASSRSSSTRSTAPG